MNNKKNKKAFSLIEILIILVIVSVGVLAAVPITTTKTHFSTWKKDTYNDQTEYVAYGHNGSGTDRIGIGVDPYDNATQGKLSVEVMGATFNNTAYNKFIFGGINGNDCANTPTFFYDGQNLNCAAANTGNIDTIWSNNNATGLIIGRNYQENNANLAHNNATIISSFENAPTAAIAGTCIGNIADTTNCNTADTYSLNDTVLITGTTTEFTYPGAANHPIVVDKSTVTINGKININNTDLYLINSVYDYSKINYIGDNGAGPYVYEASTDTLTNKKPNFTWPAKTIGYNDFTDTTRVPNKGVYYTGLYKYIDNNRNQPIDTPTITSSDLRLKNILKPYTKGIEYISKIKTHYYTFKNDAEKKLHAGIIAQEIIGIFDEALEKTKDGFYSYKKSPFLYAMVNSVKSLYAEQQDILKEQEELLKMVKNS